jgi:hypothetical protein
MLPADAAKLLDLPVEATPEQLEARFLELRTRLEDKIAKAPTPGLKAKYRESLEAITTAFETLTLAADSSSLPVTAKQGAGSREQGVSTGGPVSAPAGSSPSGLRSQVSGLQAAKRKSGSREFAIVAVIALALLGAGGWFVMKTRAENEEKARIAAEIAQKAADAKAETERQAAAAKAEQERLAGEKKAAEENERLRLEKLTGQLRAGLAEARVAWEAFEREERTAERRLAELKSDLRALRDASPGRMNEARTSVAAQQAYYDWLSETLAKHPAKIARGQAEELISSRQIDDAANVMAGLKVAMSDLDGQISAQRNSALDLEGDLSIKTHPDASWTVVDAFGRSFSGKGSATLDAVAAGSAEIQFTLPFWPVRKESVLIHRTKPTELSAEYVTYDHVIDTAPTGANVVLADGRALGTTPLQLRNLPAGRLSGVIRKQGFREHRFALEMAAGGPSSSLVTLKERPTQATRPVAWILPARLTVETRTQTSINSGRSTGLYADSSTNTNHQGHTVEEWDMSDPDANGRWQQVVRRFVRQQTSYPAPVSTGSVIQYRRQPDGKWRGEFIEGGLANANYASMVLEHFSIESWAPAERAWPPAGTGVGGTWKVPASNDPAAPAPEMTGRLVSFTKEPSRDWVELEFTQRTGKTVKDTTDESSTTTRTRIDLEGWVMSHETTSHYSTTTKVKLVGLLAVDSNTHVIVTFTPR